MSEPDAPAELRDEPLGLTVHSMPELSSTDTLDARRTASGRLKMMLVLLICAAPVVASYFTYYVIRPEGRRNFGELVSPQRPLPELTSRSLDGREARLSSLKGQWLLISVAPAACNADCQQHLYLQHQLRESLGRDKDRLDWVWLITDKQPVTPTLLPALREATVLRVDRSGLARWLAPATGHALEDHLYLVDPIGNWMMRFPAGIDVNEAAKAKADLSRLMRASEFWDRAGR